LAIRRNLCFAKHGFAFRFCETNAKTEGGKPVKSPGAALASLGRRARNDGEGESGGGGFDATKKQNKKL